MNKLPYETPEFLLALTEDEIKTDDIGNSAELTDPGIEGPEV